MTFGRSALAVLTVAFALVACKQDLLRDLPESEANEMVALLRVHRIDSVKTIEKGGRVTLAVDKGDFVGAVELLRQNGYPKRESRADAHFAQSSQLVSSPAQEKAKLGFFKERRLEDIISHIQGVVYVGVAIADGQETSGYEAPGAPQTTGPSVAVLINYAPQVNMRVLEPQIKSLVQRSVAGVRYENISVVMQRAEDRLAPLTTSADKAG